MVAIITVGGLFVLLTLPLLASGQFNSRAALCLNNLRQLTRAVQMFAAEEGHYPPNPDDGNTRPGHHWVGQGNAGTNGRQEFDPGGLADPNQSLLFPYLAGNVTVYRCPADERMGRYQGADPALAGKIVPAARSVAMNHAVGTVCPAYPGGHSGEPILATHGPWLDNIHTHTRGRTWRTYGSPDDAVTPSPAMLWLLIDEDEDSLNDGLFAFGMAQEEWIDWPGTRHDVGAGISFADGHAELRRWVDSRTIVVDGKVSRRSVPGSPDIQWLQERTSAAIRPLN